MNILILKVFYSETSTHEHYSECQVEMVEVRDSAIINKYPSLVQPFQNEFTLHN